ncbi:MAG: M23 family metallopeptidase [Gemmatimonadetes bacterium]|nr:M23 family metallopeptidase [Gemmatimonadota bacterium]
MTKSGKSRSLTIMFVPDGGQEGRTFRLSYRTLRILAGIASIGALGLTLVAGSWWYLAARASRVTSLEHRVQTLQSDQARVQELSRKMEGIEREYARLRSLFATGAPSAPSDVWLPPGTASGSGNGRVTPSRDLETASAPNSWPLTERGFVTQGLMEGDQGQHNGIDIAVPTDSYIRAAGAGTVVDVGEDPLYGRFVVIDHGDGYTSLYGHASLTLVTRGQRVRQDEVIALSGSTGQSTAPHLHFEILKDGEAVDPLTLVHQP